MTTHTTKHNAKLLKRVFGGLPVVDAKRELRLFPAKLDIGTAKRKDPTNCVFAKACRRLFGSNRVAFFRTVTYVDLPNEKGNRRIERFVNSKPARRSIEQFDKTGKIDLGGYLLLPPSRGYTMDHRLAMGRAYEATRVKDRAPKKKIAKKRLLAEVRNGKGLVQFIRATKENWVRSA